MCLRFACSTSSAICRLVPMCLHMDHAYVAHAGFDVVAAVIAHLCRHWRPRYDLEAMTRDMLNQLRKQIDKEAEKAKQKAAAAAASAQGSGGKVSPDVNGKAKTALAAQIVVPGHLT